MSALIIISHIHIQFQSILSKLTQSLKRLIEGRLFGNGRSIEKKEV